MRLSMLLMLAFLACGSVAEAAEARIIKVLPHFLDLKGRHMTSPSLYDRDAYQAFLRKHPDQRSGLRYDVQWKGKTSAGNELKLRVEVRGTAHGEPPLQKTFEQPVKQTHWFSEWSGVTLAEEDYKALGEVTAWRVTLWDGEKLLGEQKSFLW